ncbi:Brp/Blh family beta-carotene 15,15'-dioxygenase [Spongiivirga sp. MCCC 1A20706]|uniref:Brp/Blh family beta-carotene 15,15'-dioxygenase n=1 Tax=Spongiivirga sp. MCCC 1A20706 TaxID=3160963 RepID=UPI003977C899
MRSNFEKMMNLTLVSTFFCLWFTVNFEEQIEQTVAFALILSFGILHGANDFKLLRKSFSKSSSKKPGSILFIYITIVLLGAILFYYLPAIALITFILFSAYHFGEQHWEHQFKGKKAIRHLVYGFHGLVVLGMLFITNQDEVLIIVANLTTHNIPALYIGLLFTMSAILFVISVGYAIYTDSTNTIIIKELFYLFVFFIVFKLASLIWAFCIYFVLWHSIPSLFEQVKYLYGDFNHKTVLQYLKSSFAYWLVSIIGLLLIYYFLKDSQLLFLSVFFAFLAAITFPHVIVMFRLHDENKSEKGSNLKS